MNSPDFLDDYQQYDNLRGRDSTTKRRGQSKKSVSCWREIEKLKERRQLMHELVDYHQHCALSGLEAAFS